jgi:hypothetical protein
MTPEDAALVRLIERLTDKIDRYFPPDAITVEAACNILCCGLAYAVSTYEARRWIAACLRPARRPYPLGLSFLKHVFEYEEHRRHIKKGDFAKLLTEAGIKVVGDRAYCREVGNGD